MSAAKDPIQQLLFVQQAVTSAAEGLNRMAGAIEPLMQPAIEARRGVEQIISDHGPAVVAHFGLDVPPEVWEARLANELGLDAFEEARRRVMAVLRDPLDEIAE